jgi:hypothetical protein
VGVGPNKPGEEEEEEDMQSNYEELETLHNVAGMRDGD